MTQYDLKWLKDHLWRETAEYLLDAEVTPEERQEILEWVKSGNSVYSNPWYLYDERGSQVDYITAMHLMPELTAQD